MIGAPCFGGRPARPDGELPIVTWDPDGRIEIAGVLCHLDRRVLSGAYARDARGGTERRLDALAEAPRTRRPGGLVGSGARCPRGSPSVAVRVN
ncbi:hypothetical protein [Sorangium sp. So ce1024]|uniref:hypothetical protein n=1 Tax=Sorangium sp. So ce1024 TaxID=3133327 RepID=UPI003F0BE93B